MALFGPKRSDPPTAAAATPGIAAFWDWWTAHGAGDTALAITERRPEQMTDELTRRVTAVHPALAWELATGLRADHLLVVTAEGNPELAGTARRWLRSAPPTGPVWEYADSRQPAPDLQGIRLSIGGHELGFGEVLVSPRRVGFRYDISVHHPLFAQLPEDARLQITYLALDAAVGETAVETWIGEVTATEAAPLDAFAIAHLRALVDDLATEAIDENGAPAWVLLRGQGSAGPVLASAQVPLSATVAPDLDHHIAVTVGFADCTPEGFPGDRSLLALRDLEDRLVARLGDAGRLVAHETCAGVRSLHFYVESAAAVADQLRRATRGWREGRVTVSAEADPGWSAVRHLRA